MWSSLQKPLFRQQPVTQYTWLSTINSGFLTSWLHLKGRTLHHISLHLLSLLVGAAQTSTTKTTQWRFEDGLCDGSSTCYTFKRESRFNYSCGRRLSCISKNFSVWSVIILIHQKLKALNPGAVVTSDSLAVLRGAVSRCAHWLGEMDMHGHKVHLKRV